MNDNASKNKTSTAIIDRIKAWPQYLLPQTLLSSLMYKITRSEISWWKNLFIRWFAKQYQVDLSEAEIEDITAFPTFNAFFTRALKPTARRMVSNANAVLSPVDGAISQFGNIDDTRLFQAKGHEFELAQLLADNEAWCRSFQNGSFITIYLSPKDYHRIHMPVSGTVTQLTYVPGRLFSVSPATTRVIPGLFARNERLLIHFNTPHGEMLLIMVGAIFVSGMETVFTGEITPPHNGPFAHYDYRGKNLTLEQGDELGRFNMGSTVILLFQENAVEWQHELAANQKLLLGEQLAMRK